MIVSHRHKYIFIKTAKTAGTSLELFLSKFRGPDDIFTPIYPIEKGHSPQNHRGFHNHMSAKDIRSKLDPHTWNTYFKFCVERNPWDKTISHYYWTADQISTPTKPTFNEYLVRGNYCVNFPLYTEPDSGNEIIVDKVVRYENFIDSLSVIFDTLKIPFSGNLGVNAKSRSRHDRGSYHEFYTNAQAKLISKVFSTEISMHGYTY